jgi:hypothetical protein
VVRAYEIKAGVSGQPEMEAIRGGQVGAIRRNQLFQPSRGTGFKMEFRVLRPIMAE